MNKERSKTSGVSDSFALALLKLEQESNSGSNVLVSPLSVSLALGMMLNGSRGTTRQQASAALGFGVGRSLRGINETYASLRQSLAASTDVDLDIANSLVACSGSTLKPNFVNKAQQYFDARIRLLDFDDPSAPVLMNSFICQKTKGKVSSILDQVENDPDFAQMILLNAVYFHGLWSTGFDQLLTQKEKFTRLDGSKRDCALMFRQSNFSYLGNLKFQALRLPYGQTGRFAFYVFLPLADGAFGLTRMFDELEDEGLSSVFKRFTLRQGRFYLPRFKAEYASTLNDSLKRLGLGEVFEQGQGDLASLAKGDLAPRITLKHKTVMELNEDSADGESEMPQQGPGPLRLKSHLIAGDTPFILRADRPFCFFVRDDLLETVNIAGYIGDPQWTQLPAIGIDSL